MITSAHNNAEKNNIPQAVDTLSKLQNKFLIIGCGYNDRLAMLYKTFQGSEVN
jgi:hypothetical protein